MIEDHICNGDYVLVERASEARDGEIIVALVDGMETTLKRFYLESGDRVRLQPANASMEPIFLPRTSVAVLLVSPDFLASDFIHEHELGPLLNEAAAGGVTILWVLIRDCSHEETPLASYQAVVSPPDKPFASMPTPKRDSAWNGTAFM